MAEAGTLQLEYDAFGRLVLTLESGVRHMGVVPVRAFPFTSPQGWVVLCDEHGREVTTLPDLAVLAEGPRKLLEADLARREFTPRIERIYSVSAGADPTDWHVQTDRGETRFTLAGDDHIRRLGDHGALLTDAAGVRYRIMDLRSLDPVSRRILRRYL